MRMHRKVIVVLGVSLVPIIAHAQESTCAVQTADLSKVSDQYKPQLDQISQDGQKLGDEAKDKSDFSIEMETEFKEQHWIFDLPSITVKNQDIIFGLPQVTMKTKEMSLDIPVTKMELKKVGQYPEVSVSGFPPQVTVRWKDILAHVPVTTMERKDFSMDIPEVKMEDVKIVMGIPEIKMERQDWYVKIPEFKLKKIQIAGAPIYNDYSKRGSELESRANGVKTEMKGQLVTKTNGLFACLRADVAAKRSKALEQISKGIAGMKSSAEQLKANGIDPSTIMITIEGASKSLSAAIADMEAKSAEISAKFDKTAGQLDYDEQASVAKITA